MLFIYFNFTSDSRPLPSLLELGTCLERGGHPRAPEATAAAAAARRQMLVPLLARMLAPRAGVVCGAPLTVGPCRAAACMRAPPDNDSVRPASASASGGRGSLSELERAADSRRSWSELVDCFRAYQADTDHKAFPGTPGTPGTGFTVPAGFVAPV